MAEQIRLSHRELVDRSVAAAAHVQDIKDGTDGYAEKKRGHIELQPRDYETDAMRSRREALQEAVEADIDANTKVVLGGLSIVIRGQERIDTQLLDREFQLVAGSMKWRRDAFDEEQQMRAELAKLNKPPIPYASTYGARIAPAGEGQPVYALAGTN